MTDYRFLRAAQWGMTWRTGTPLPSQPGRSYAVIHHVGGTAWMDNADATVHFQALNRLAHSKGHSGVDYSCLVHYHRGLDLATIGEGNGIYQAAATLDLNSQSKAYCLLGNTHIRAALPQEVEAMARATRWGIELGWNTGAPSIIAHRDNPAHPGATACPGDFFYPHMDTVRRRVTELGHPLPEPAPEPPDPGDDMEIVKLDAQSPALYQLTASVIRWVSPEVWQALGHPTPTRVLSVAEARELVLAGPSPDGAGAFARQVA